MRSIRIRILVGVITALTFVILAAITAIYSHARFILNSEFDNAIFEKAFVLSTLTEFTENGLAVDFDESDFEQIGDSGTPLYFQIWREDGTTLLKSRSLGKLNLQSHDSVDGPVFWDVDVPDAKRSRSVTLNFHPKVWDELCEVGTTEIATNDVVVPPLLASDQTRIAEKLTIAAAAPTTEVDAVTSRLFWFLCLVAVSVLTLIPALVFVMVWVGFQPLKSIATDISRIDEKELGYRLQSNSTPSEIVPIVDRLNGLLQRIESTVQRERSFSSDVSHELRTPLSGISSTIEVCLAKPRDSREYTETLELCYEICRQSQRMVDDLLAISQLENENVECDYKNVDFSQMVADCWQPMQEQAAEKNVKVVCKTPDNIQLMSDPEKLRLIIRNLFQNAVSYCDRDGEIFIESSPNADGVSLVIQNSGNLVQPDQVESVYERFWRGDKSRSKTGDHFGLGLYLVKRLVDVLGANITITPVDNIFRVELKLVPPTN